jgi:hypothetical protein
MCHRSSLRTNCGARRGARERDNAGLFFATSDLAVGPQRAGMRDQFRPESDHGPIDGFWELSAFVRVSRAESWGKKSS